jgi:hypothetical protein
LHWELSRAFANLGRLDDAKVAFKAAKINNASPIPDEDPRLGDILKKHLRID